MTGYIAIATNPFFAVTGDDGSFKLENLPAGSYTVEAWHERLGTRTAEVKVEGDAAAPVAAAFEFAAP
jgi:uncharacterized protein (DUF2141 family)